MAKQEQKKPNILVIWGDDIGISNLTKWVLFNAESVPLLDVTGADALEELRSELAGREIVLAVARGKGLFRVMLERTGVAGRIGAERLFPTVRAGAEAFLERAP